MLNVPPFLLDNNSYELNLFLLSVPIVASTHRFSLQQLRRQLSSCDSYKSFSGAYVNCRLEKKCKSRILTNLAIVTSLSIIFCPKQSQNYGKKLFGAKMIL